MSETLRIHNDTMGYTIEFDLVETPPRVKMPGWSLGDVPMATVETLLPLAFPSTKEVSITLGKNE